ncbi:hypothetical protein TpMuguga_02g02590 [Theileria parva strain Muguga]|uniref:uncharacterized protein n=1 Tax=Theileria parva strain Muguga TaxID=333668 RepID=UPI001C617796|nr:uncharacterized protein TpMuguga_02g02590 [Theileria parva strain Muguga]KAF5153560.1 hypothetical protein TpMuguga_02g02590 [Theileria parva strain Muguga]
MFNSFRSLGRFRSFCNLKVVFFSITVTFTTNGRLFRFYATRLSAEVSIFTSFPFKQFEIFFKVNHNTHFWCNIKH